MRWRNSLCLLLALVWFGLYLAGWYLELTRPAAPKEAKVHPRIVYIPPGTPFERIATLLKKEGLIHSKWGFTLEAFRLGLMDKLKAGEYEIDPRMSPAEILRLLAEGRVVTYLITVPEGYNLWQIARLLAKVHICSQEEFFEIVRDQEFLKEMGIPGKTAEGFLFPDTYAYYRGLSCRAMITKMIQRFWEVWQEFAPRAEELGLDVYQVVTLASIVEKEALDPRERPLIAGVFWNRLKRGMPLQADPTVRYAVKKFRSRLRKRDLRVRNPYNTYIYRGLPPGPICSPGKDSIRAVLWPAKTDYLYFVAKGDGTHYFSRTLKEHWRAVLRYQLGRPVPLPSDRPSRKGSSPKKSKESSHPEPAGAARPQDEADRKDHPSPPKSPPSEEKPPLERSHP